MISIVACCHGAKLCAHTARDFRSQQYQVHALGITIKLASGENLGGCMDIVRPGVTFNSSALVASEGEKGNRLMLEVFSKPVVHS